MIRVLAPEVVNQIAAGEVVERPFSVVKELVENALDAGARSVRVEIVDGGRSSIRVLDDGDGFLPEDLELAFVSHATSKLREADDLSRIASLGFRGEALASIGSIARATIRSRRKGAEEGWEIRADAGRIGERRPAGCPVGTCVEVDDLFCNVPARRKFLRTPAAERARIQELLARLSLAHLDTTFVLEADGRELLRLTAGEGLARRFARAFGEGLARGLLPVQHKLGKVLVEGVVAGADHARHDSTLELLYVNGRSARDRSATFAVRQAFKEFLMPGRFPIYALLATMPPDEVDVNVHPTKSEVRFLDSRQVCAALHAAARSALLGTGNERHASGLAVGEDRPRARGGLPPLGGDLFGRGPTATAPLAGVAAEPAATVDAAASDAGQAPTRPHPFRSLRPGAILQVHDLYLVVEGGDGLVVVDQHALHERVVYERLRARHVDRGVAVQRLLAPVVVELLAGDKAYLLDSRDALAAEGFLVDDFGGSSVAVHGVPQVVAKTPVPKLIDEFLRGRAAGDRPAASASELVAERFHSMACRAAVMSGDRLAPQECEALLEAARHLEHPHNCPHGRPTVLTFTWPELERYFRRKL